MKVFGYRLPGMSSLLLWGLLWEIIGQLGLTFFVPPLSEVLRDAVRGDRHARVPEGAVRDGLCVWRRRHRLRS